MARPRLKPTYCRNKGIRFRCTDEELQIIRDKAARSGMNVSEYIRTVIGMEWTPGDGTGDPGWSDRQND